MILGLQSYVIAAQVPTKEELWHRYDSALSADIEEWKQAVILSSLDSIRNCLRMPYSSQRVGFYLNEVDTLYMNPDLQEPEREILDTLRLLIENYQEETAKFIDIFSGQIIDSTRFSALVGRERHTPGQVKQIMEILNEDIYLENGLDTLKFDEAYEYLNANLSCMKNDIDSLLQSDSDQGSELYKQLMNIVKIESELSDEHKTYRKLKNEEVYYINKSADVSERICPGD